MGAISDILSGLDLDQIASALGQDPAHIESAASTAVSSLLGGIEGNLADPTAATKFANALGQHVGSPAAGAGLGAIDFGDGAKIVNHVLPGSQQQQLFGGVQGALVKKLLPLVAPLVMAYLAKKLGGGLTKGGGIDSGLGSILGSVLGGGASADGLGSALGPILGSVLGGGSQASGGALGDILGQVLGGSQSGAPTTTAPASVPAGGGLGDILGQVLSGVQQQASTSGLTLPDPGADAAAASADQGDAIGGLLKSILFG